MASCGRMVRDSAMVTMESLSETSIPFPKMRVSNAPQDQLRDVCCHLTNMIEDIDKIPFAYDRRMERCRLLPYYFGFKGFINACHIALPQFE